MKPASLRRTLLVRLMGPLVAVVLVSGASAFGLAQYFSRNVLDQWLYDSAVTLASQVRFVAGTARLDIPGSAIEMFEVDLTDRIFYDVSSPKGGRILSNAVLPAIPDGELAPMKPHYYDGGVQGIPVRVIALLVTSPEGEPVLVKVAETRRKREALANEIVVATLLIVLVLVATSVVLIWRGIGGSLASLEDIVRDVRRTYRNALAPLPRGGNVPQEVHPLLDAIDDLIAELAGQHAARQRFIADAAHQLRTPLASVRVQLDLALREKDPERRQQELANASAVLSRTGHLIHRLLTLARVDQDAAEGIALDQVDLDGLARDEVERWIDRAIARSVDLGYDGPGKPVIVQGKDAWLREALANLLDNALLYGAAGGRVTVVVRGDPPEFFVEDHGRGIPESERARVPDRFYRIPGTPGEGCGLGLAIVDEVAKRHGASFLLTAGAVGTGLRAGIRFPAAGPHDGNSPAAKLRSP
jgi:two-component system sensor histidine kinase TctE